MKSPVPTPRVYWHSDDRRILGAPFFFCERVAGRAPLPSVGAPDDPVPVHREAMAASIARIAEVARGRVSVKATTTEGMGYTGREEGLLAQAVVSVETPI